jgi:hypothetical protein
VGGGAVESITVLVFLLLLLAALLVVRRAALCCSPQLLLIPNAAVWMVGLSKASRFWSNWCCLLPCLCFAGPCSAAVCSCC